LNIVSRAVVSIAIVCIASIVIVRTAIVSAAPEGAARDLAPQYVYGRAQRTPTRRGQAHASPRGPKALTVS
jgi:hypothetical protein